MKAGHGATRNNESWGRRELMLSSGRMVLRGTWTLWGGMEGLYRVFRDHNLQTVPLQWRATTDHHLVLAPVGPESGKPLRGGTKWCSRRNTYNIALGVRLGELCWGNDWLSAWKLEKA